MKLRDLDASPSTYFTVVRGVASCSVNSAQSVSSLSAHDLFRAVRDPFDDY